MPVVVHRAHIGRGLVTTRRFRRGETIVKLAGKVVDADVLWDRGGTFANNCIRFGPNTYLDPGDRVGRYLNHSCEPNAGIRKSNGQLFLFAAAVIRKGAEVLIDYSTTIGDDDIWTMRCRCGRDPCRRTIRRFGALPPELQASYIERGMVPRYILEAEDLS